MLKIVFNFRDGSACVLCLSVFFWFNLQRRHQNRHQAKRKCFPSKFFISKPQRTENQFHTFQAFPKIELEMVCFILKSHIRKITRQANKCF